MSGRPDSWEAKGIAPLCVVRLRRGITLTGSSDGVTRRDATDWGEPRKFSVSSFAAGKNELGTTHLTPKGVVGSTVAITSAPPCSGEESGVRLMQASVCRHLANGHHARRTLALNGAPIASTMLTLRGPRCSLSLLVHLGPRSLCGRAGACWRVWMRWHGRQQSPRSCSLMCPTLAWWVPSWRSCRCSSPCGGCMPRCSTTNATDSQSGSGGVACRGAGVWFVAQTCDAMDLSTWMG